ncbi:MAG: helix-turn-helix domain-containing protein [Planctomycetota bacterium]
MEDQLTTRQVAAALSVSESSVKRWCDSGDIPTERTVGGHRRIPLAGLLEFLERTNRRVVSPLIPPVEAKPTRQVPPKSRQDVSTERFLEALVGGDEDAARRILTIAYAQQESFAWLADEYIAKSMVQVGDLWDCGSLNIYQERHGCEICSRLIYEMGRLLPDPPLNAPLALGGTPTGDLYSLPSQIVQMVFKESGWRALNLGTNLPLPSIVAAAEQHKPKMVWLSCSYLRDPEQFVEQYSGFIAELPDETMVVIGGRALNDSLRPRLKYTGHCDNMQQLAAFAAALHGKRPSIESSEN